MSEGGWRRAAITVVTDLLHASVLLLCGGGWLDVTPTMADCLPAACDPLCVEAGRYRVTEDVVDDTAQEHRLWQRRTSERHAWEDAVRYCADLTLDGLRGWRLPSPAELQGIRYKPGGLFGESGRRHYCIPSIDQAAFPETPADQFWTSRRMPDDTAWYVDFGDGRSHRDVRSDALWVRCTLDPPSP
jgi:hypothetical protein